MAEDTGKPLIEHGATLPFDGEEAQAVLHSLQSYKAEAETNRQAGMNPRDDKWRENLDLYWNRYDFTGKADWQAQEVLPEVPTFVDRFAGAMKEALVATPSGFYTVVDPANQEGDVANVIKRMLDCWLSICGKNQSGHLLSFDAVFEDQIKLGALMACCASVTWKEDEKFGRVSVESVDPRFVWFDHTFRNLYRLRSMEIDRHELKLMLKLADKKGKSIYNIQEMGRLVHGLEMADQAIKQRLTGGGEEISSYRVPIKLDEYIATVLNSDGSVEYDRALCIVANDRYLIRGPEKVPYWHGKDWLVYTPMVPVPLSPYGRSYMEDIGSVARAFNELTNLILDAVFSSSIRSWAVVPGMLENPEDMATGYTPGKTWVLEDGMDAKQFASALDTGQLPPESFQLWSALKNELREGSVMNEIGLGGFAPKARTSATEVSGAQENSSRAIRSMAHTIETQHLNVILDLMWKTGVQHVTKTDPRVIEAAGPEMFQAFMKHRKELAEYPITFQARGITTLIDKSSKLKSLLSVLQIIASNEILLAAFLKEISPARLVKTIFELGNLDMFQLQPTEREKLMAQMQAPVQRAQERSEGTKKQPGSAGGNAVGELARILGGGGG